MPETSEPLRLPRTLLAQADMVAACRARDFATIFRLVKTRAGVYPSKIGRLCDMTPSRVGEVLSGKRVVTHIDVIERIADGLRIPGSMLGLGARTWEAATSRTEPGSSPSLDIEISGPVPGHDLGLAYSPSVPDTLRTVTELGSGDVRRRDFIRRAAYTSTALAAPTRDWLIASLDAIDADRGSRIGAEQVEDIRTMFGLFQEMDVIGGGGEHVRRTVAQYLSDHVMPMIHDQHSEPVQRTLYEVASEQTYLAGWMAFDCGRNGLAQRYLTQSLRLAQASGSRVLGAHVLAGLSDQATQLGHPYEGLNLAKAGQHGLRGTHAPAALTDLYVLQARAHAAMRDPEACAQAIDAAERAYDRINVENEPEWARFIDEAYVTGEIATSLRDIADSENAGRFAERSIAACERQGRHRRSTLSHVVLASIHAQRSDPEASANAARTAVTLAQGTPSVRCTRALNQVRTHLEPHGAHTAVRGVLPLLPSRAAA